jgi:hypothetical protein
MKVEEAQHAEDVWDVAPLGVDTETSVSKRYKEKP